MKKAQRYRWYQVDFSRMKVKVVARSFDEARKVARVTEKAQGANWGRFLEVWLDSSDDG